MAVIDVYQNQAKLGAPAGQTSGARPDMGGQMALAKALRASMDAYYAPRAVPRA